MSPTDTKTAQPADPCTMVIFGASGDLTHRKLLPALYNLQRKHLLPENFAVIGFARSALDDNGFRNLMREAVRSYAGERFQSDAWATLEKGLHYVPGEFTDEDAFGRLKARLEDIEKERGTRGNVLFYMATAPSFFAPVIRRLHELQLTREENGRWRRVIIEKPFGRDLDSAHALNCELREVLEENQTYRIDHYLGKETVQNILVFRFANGIFEPIWNQRYVDHVQITVAETLGVGSRGGYYDKAGALRDMVPNHIFQLISLVAMEPPISFEADAVRDEQSKLLRAIGPIEGEAVLTDAVRGQYGGGQAGGVEIPAYREEDRVPKDSNTETYVALRLEIDNWRWKGVPFYLRVGKALKQRVTEITIRFRQPPLSLFRDTDVDNLTPNELVINVQPDEGITLHFGAKIPGATMKLGHVNMEFCYSEHFGREPATGYERLLYDAMLGGQTLFQRSDMVEAGWRIVTPILDVWRALPARDFPNYAAGSWGPAEADELLERAGHAWRHIEETEPGCPS